MSRGQNTPPPPSISKCGPPEQLQGRVQLKVPGEPGLEQNCSVTSSAESNNKHTPINIFRRCTIKSRQTLRLRHSALKPQTFTQKACTETPKREAPNAQIARLLAYRGTSVSSRRCLLWLSASPMAVIMIRVRRVVIVLLIIIVITTIILILTDNNSSLGYFGQFPWRCCRSTQAAPRTYVLRSTCRFMGSYNWGSKSPNMGY